MSIRSKNKTRAVIAAQGKHSVIINRTNKHFYAQVLSPEGTVLGGASTKSAEVIKKMKKNSSSNCISSKIVGEYVCELLKKLKIDKFAFNRSGYIYHGRVKAFVEGLFGQDAKNTGK
ncbi:MAG: 50S ribosomal protein L18 [Pseudomonadota bacterium]|nr:50S ribosomal protein L18 [Pseudomonadota bacterium]